jgi:capsular polysaccharide transport system permease protein
MNDDYAHGFAEKSFSYALRENVRVISALVIRTAVARFSKSRIGPVLVLAEPAAFLGIFIFAHTYMQHNAIFGDNAILFILTGVFGFRMTRGISRKAERGIVSNQPMLTYPLVRPLDTIVATFLFESIIWLIICAIFMGGLSFTMDRAIIVYPGDFTECLLAILFFAFSFATFNAAVGALVPRYDIFMNVMNMPLMLLSGIFFMPAQMSPEVQAILWWNPFLHCVEWFRTSTYIDYIPLLSKTYLIGVSATLLTLALIMERVYRRRIISG